jgi:hypothetical protein
VDEVGKRKEKKIRLGGGRLVIFFEIKGLWAENLIKRKCKKTK